MLEGQFAGLLGRISLFHRLPDNLRVVRLANRLIKAAIGTAATHRGYMTILAAIVEDCLKRVAGKALKIEIGPREESAAFRILACYRKENIEMRVDVFPNLIDSGAVRIGPSQVRSEMTGPFRQIIGRKLMIHVSTSESALVRGHLDDRAALIVLIQ